MRTMNKRVGSFFKANSTWAEKLMSFNLTKTNWVPYSISNFGLLSKIQLSYKTLFYNVKKIHIYLEMF